MGVMVWMCVCGCHVELEGGDRLLFATYSCDYVQDSTRTGNATLQL